MFRPITARRLSRREFGSMARLTVALVCAAAVVRHGPLIDKPVNAPVAALLERGQVSIASEADGRFMGVTWDLPNLDHQSVDKWINRFTGRLKQDLVVYVERMAGYADMIHAKAQEKGVPRDLVFLALIESGGNPTAKSRVGARGLWQFMAPTAKDYGLTSHERLDPVKSTDAALEYLSDLYNRFGSWYLAAAAYNTGQGRVAKVLKSVTGRSTGTDEDFYRISSRLPQETRDYVPRLIAAARIAKEPEKYGLGAEVASLAGKLTTTHRGP